MVLDDLSCYEPGLFFAEDKLGAKFPPFIPVFQLADRSRWNYRVWSCDVLRRWLVCYWLRGHTYRHLSYNPLYQSAQELGRCLPEFDLPPSSQVSASIKAGACQILASPDIIIRQRSTTAIQAHPVLQFYEERRAVYPRPRHRNR